MRLTRDIRERIYAGVLGKMTGVYLGRPVEGWTYEAIRSRFGEISTYIHDELNLPLVVTDDDLSGTFGFFRAVEDGGFGPTVTAKAVGEAWLNYIVEDKTILWWGGMGNSTEHTAYLNLKRGIPAPESGSAARNGRVLSEQIGAEIFMDAFAMMCPGDPERAAQSVRAAASVSHDGIAVEAAVFLGALEAAAFVEQDLDRLFDENERFLTSDNMRRLVGDVRNACAKAGHWREVRDFLDRNYGYDRFGGECHIVPNHALTLASILLGGDDFARALMIAVSAGWDTDCNAGNVGCFNGIRLGLDALTKERDFRAPVRDRLFVITADGGEGISDAVREARKIVRAAAVVQGETANLPTERFAFEFRGSVQGFEPCPCVSSDGVVRLTNPDGRGLCISAVGKAANVSTPTFFDPNARWQGYDAIASPSLYEGQTVTARLDCDATHPPTARLYVCRSTDDGAFETVFGDSVALRLGTTQISWTIPPLGGQPILRVGISLCSRTDRACAVELRSLDWAGAPLQYRLAGVLRKNITDPAPFVLRQFVSSAKNFGLSLTHTLCVSHPDENGAVTFGTRDFDDYSVSARLTPQMHRRCGLVIRARGHRQYYAALLTGGDTLAIVLQDAAGDTILAQTGFAYAPFEPLAMTLIARGNRLEARIGETTLTAMDAFARYPSGGVGFRVDAGTMMVDDVSIRRG
ncbi:MAG: ADP-ribosylglycohydrolase family protein [Clostridiales bacterium]|nr:ADP-ribosylglycohydrolase family protein [Clostridiales bacterium]